jgi:DNA repair protein RadA/Sms
MPKARTVYVCQSCGGQSPKWLGRCAECGTWNSLVEEAAGTLSVDASPNGGNGATPIRLIDVPAQTADIRYPTGIGELDRVLGGGLVAGSVALLGGDPGIGKSTLLLQLAERLAQSGQTVLYVSGEESIQQIRFRAERLGVQSDGVWLLAETSLERVLAAARARAPQTLIVDSVQTLRSEALESSAGSVGQVRDVAGHLMVLAKQTGIATFLVGHVTKDGAIAGPRVLEHIVDTVLYFEGEKGHPYRIIRTVKNRFGSTQEVGVFEMKGYGLAEVPNPSELFLAERSHGSSGSAIIASAEGTRPILVELQALVTAPSGGLPRRTANGIEPARLSLLLAVLEKRVGLGVGGQDVFVNVAGGLGLEEPAADLGIAAAVASSWRDRPIDPRTVVFGEIGLAGEIRSVPQAESRLREAAALGFTCCVLPARNAEHLANPPLKTIGVHEVREALEVLGVG